MRSSDSTVRTNPSGELLKSTALYRGRLDADDVLRALVELGDPFADAHQQFFDVRLRLRTGGRHGGERERQCQCARQHNGIQQPCGLRSLYVLLP